MIGRVLNVALIALVGCSSPDASVRDTLRGRRPNIVLIMADDLGFECVGANGGESYATPRLDGMAAEGLRFTRAYSTPLCTPSRVQIMTGRLGYRNYVRFGYLDPSERTFANELHDAGYATCMVGKWQLTYGDIDPERPRTLGFDEWTLWNSRGKAGARYADPKLDVNGDVHTFEGEYGPRIVLDHALDFVSRDRSEPFFLYYPMILPHSPFVSTPRSEPRLKKQDAYAAMLEYVDFAVGELLDRLDELGIADDTLVVFTGDNGTPRSIVSRWNGVDVAGGKGLHVERGMRVPMIARWPGTVARGVTDDLVDFSDLLPTLLDVAGASRARPDVPIDGISFAPRLRGHDGAAREISVSHYDPRWNVPGKPGRAAFDGRYRLYDDGRLLDFANDAVEGVDVAADDPSSGEVRAKLQAALDRLPHWDPPESAKAR